MIYLEEMRTSFDELFAWYLAAGGRTPTAPEELFQVYRWLFATGMGVQHAYGHSWIKDLEKPYSIVELGTGYGVTSILMARGFKDGNKQCKLRVACKVRTVDSGKECDVALTKALIGKARGAFGLQIDFSVGNDLDSLSAVADESIDFLFIDANHGYDDVTRTLDLALTKVVKMGRITGHDYDFNDVGVPIAIDEWRVANADFVVGWATYDSLWWMMKR